MNNALTLYQRSSDFLWTDPHIAKQMLKLHLDPENDAASRNAKSIGAAVQWISTRVPANGSIVDLGCGPGLYAERLASLGFRITGIDISKNTIRYAAASARRKKLNISYLNRSYLADPIPGTHDAALCIYCDFGALIPEEQTVFLDKVRNALTDGGVFIFDVFGEKSGLEKKEERSWDYCPGPGFWSAKPHWILGETRHFPECNAWGTRHIIFDGLRKREFITWDTLYSEERIASMLSAAGFAVEEIAGQLVGENDFASNDVLFVKARKKKKEQIMYEFDTKLGKKEVGALNVFHTFVKNPFVMPICMAVFGGWFLYNFFDERDYVYLAMAAVFGAGFPGLCFLMMKFMTWLNIRSSPMISDDNKIRICFTPEKIEYRTDMPGMSSTTVMEWKLLHKAYETKTHYFLYLSNLQSFILPKVTMTSGAVPDFTRILKERLGNKYKRRFLREKK